MTIRYAILGLLSWTPLSGYDLKKKFAESDFLYWTGNNNQIYRTLIDLHREGLVSQEVQPQESLPARKVYSITEAGRAALREWVLSAPELPQVKHPFLIQLAWADALTPAELDDLLDRYADEVRVKRLMLDAQQPRRGFPQRTPREAVLWDQIAAHGIAFYEHELEWVNQVRAALQAQEEQG